MYKTTLEHTIINSLKQKQQNKTKRNNTNNTYSTYSVCQAQ